MIKLIGKGLKRFLLLIQSLNYKIKLKEFVKYASDLFKSVLYSL